MSSSRKLIFAYIQRSRCLNHVNLNFDAEYSFSYNPKTCQLAVKHNEMLESDFWHGGISSVAVIAGQNGTGKTSALRWLLEKTLPGDSFPYDSNDGLHGIIILQAGNTLIGYHDFDEDPDLLDKEEVKVEWQNTKGWSNSRLAEALSFNPIYYSGHFDSHVGNPDFPDDDKRVWNISDKWLLIDESQEAAIGDSMLFPSPIVEYLNAYHANNDLRICKLLFDSRFQKSFSHNGRYIIRIPRYIVFISKEDVGHLLKSEVNNLSLLTGSIDGEPWLSENHPKTDLRILQQVAEVRPNIHMERQDEADGKTGLSEILYRALRRFYYHLHLQGFLNGNGMVMNYVSDLFIHDYTDSELSASEWVQMAREKVEYRVNQVQRKNSKTPEKEYRELLDFFVSLEKTILFLNKLPWKDGKAFIDCGMSESRTPTTDSRIYAYGLPSIYGSLFEDISQIERFCNLTYSHVMTEGSSLSSGELAMLNLYSRIKYALEAPLPENYKIVTVR